MTNSVTIGGRRIELPPGGGSVTVIDDEIFVDGKPWRDVSGDPAETGRVLRIELTGDLISLQCDRPISITGGVGGDVKCPRGNVTVGHDVNGHVDAGGNATVGGAVGGPVDAGGNVTCGNVSGGVDAGGNVRCGSVSGDVDAGGSVRHG